MHGFRAEQTGEEAEAHTICFVLSTLYPDLTAATKGKVGAVENMTALPKLMTVSRTILLPRMIAEEMC
jgi:hypothetical protein